MTRQRRSPTGGTGGAGRSRNPGADREEREGRGEREEREGRPPWVWDDLPAPERRELWRRLVAWVQWLQESYAPWVELPACWPGHEGLRVELIQFWCWHDWLTTGETDPAVGVRWHAELRRAAESWRDLATCDHRPPGPEQRRILAAQRARRDEFVAAATGE